MFAGKLSARGTRRGVILLVVLGMLGLLALIGVTFATFSAQARISARNFSQRQNFPEASEVMDFALSQLVDDTFNPLSAIRGHSLKRDMYGNDATYNGYLDSDPLTGNPLLFTNAQVVSAPGNPFNGTIACAMNVNASNPALYGYYDFTRWIVRFPARAAGGVYYVSESFEVIADDYSGGNNPRILYLVPRDNGLGGGNPARVTTDGYATSNPVSTLLGQITGAGSPIPVSTPQAQVPFVLDGRYLRAFNGPGLSAPVSYTVGSTNYANPANVYGNFRVNGLLLGSPFGPLGDPDAVGMDEDYDACDLDNWFLAIQSADGQTVIPSFHRPAILRADSTSNYNPPNAPWSPQSPTDWNGFAGTTLTSPPSPIDSAARILRPRQTDGHSPLSFPDLIPDANGQITYDVDNDGDGITDSVWLDLGYPAKRDPNGQLYKPLFSFLIVGLNGRIPLNTAGNLQDVNPNVPAGSGYPGISVTFSKSNHASSRLGYSPSEVDPTYALQNAADPTGSLFTQVDNALTPINLTQLRNLLAGTRPQDSLTAPSGNNGDLNSVLVNGQLWFVPNGKADTSNNPSPWGVWDNFSCQDANGNPAICRATRPVPGRWGEGDYIPGYPAPVNVITSPGYQTTVGPGLSLNYSPGASVGIEDDNFTSFDPTGAVTDFLDLSGSVQLPVERIRRFGVPIDLTGNGLVVSYNVPVTSGSTGTGPDAFGRVMFQGYFRPGSRPTLIGNQPPVGGADMTTNPLHGYDAERRPLLNAPPNPPYPPNDNTLVAAATGGGMGVRLGQNEADEMRLYTASEYDSSFDVGDLQWLYRLQDSDGPTLTSRLQSLAPVSFLNPKDGARRRRLFALDTWETTNFAWAPDNPLGAFPDNSRFGINPSQFTPAGGPPPLYLPVTANASFANLNLTQTEINNYLSNGVTYPFGYFSPRYNLNNPNIAVGYGPYSAYGAANTASAISPDPTPPWPARTPPLAHRDRKINLNYPLPISNDPNEPVRQKWISETYYLLKSILPPQSIDTPAECAQLSQFVINIIDFRDPDGTMTHWVNPDVHLVAPTGGAAPVAPQIEWASAGAGAPLDQYGMEYQPIAINEVLAYSFLRKDLDAAKSTSTTPVATALPTNRFFVELVNTLTQSGRGPTSAPGVFDPTDARATGSAAPTGLDLTNWDLVVAEDDAIGRPDPTTGQLVTASLLGTTSAAGELYGPIPITPASFVDFKQVTPTTSPTLPTAALTQQVQMPGLLGQVNQTNPFQNGNPTVPTAVSGTTTPNSTSPPPWGPGAAAQTQAALNYYFVIGNLLPIIPKTNSPSPTDSAKPEFVSNGATACENSPPLITNPIPDQIMTLMDGNSAKTRKLQEIDIFDSPWTSAAGVSAGSVTPNSYLSNSNLLSVKDGNGVYTLFNGINPAAASNMYPVPQLNPGQVKYYWLYLRRPANPFLPSTGTTGPNPMVVIDSMRFSFIEGGGTVTKIDQGGYADTVTPGTNTIYSTQRLQPFRGGHAVKSSFLVSGSEYTTAYGAAVPPGILPTLGLSEQTAPATASTSNPGQNFGYFGQVTNKITQPIFDTLGQQNVPSESWDYFPFHDRDFMNVAELVLVPGCPPGLFTKQFVENAPGNFTPTTPTYQPTSPGAPAGAQPLVVNTNSPPIPAVPHVYPYLVDNFFYTAGSPTLLNPVGAQGTTGPMWPRTGGPTGAGWHKMFEFFEVPSPAFGSIGTVASGTNYDWARQDKKPGLLNLNLIVDEEVWLGLMGNLGLPNDSRNSTSIPMMNSVQILNPAAAGAVENGTPLQTLNVGGTPTPVAVAPHVVTLTDLSGAPYAYSNSRLMTYPMANVGFFTQDPLTSNNDNRMKAAFSDFLKLRHGGSGYVFAWGTGSVGSVPGWGSGTVGGTTVAGGQVASPNVNPGAASPASERPFRTLSFPDIDYTIVRPAALPPPPGTATPRPLQYPTRSALVNAGAALYWDPGVKDPYALYPYTPPTGSQGTDVYPVAPLTTYEPADIPPRRLFEIPDAYGTGGTAAPSNASLTGSGRNNYVPDLMLSNNAYDLTAGTNLSATPPTSVYLGNATMGAMTPPYDNRQHPYFRTEWLQKVMNLTTVRTHQYAVWITVAFFQVTKQGDPTLASDPNNFTGAVDLLGDEMNVSSGRQIRYRAFFLLDRTRAVGFNPGAPGDFRNVVVSRQTIE